jgi:hypothetical protein
MVVIGLVLLLVGALVPNRVCLIVGAVLVVLSLFAPGWWV